MARLSRREFPEPAPRPHVCATDAQSVSHALRRLRHDPQGNSSLLPYSPPDPRRNPTTGAGKRSPALSEARLRQQAIGSRLRELFDEVVNEPVPEEFLDILRRADSRDAGNDQ